jgi:putative NADH-flavin reductase
MRKKKKTMDSSKIPILIAGATGQLGKFITEHSLANSKLQVNILVRNSEKNKELVEKVTKAGGKVHIGDITDPKSLQGVTKDIHTVISAVSGDESIFVEAKKLYLMMLLLTALRDLSHQCSVHIMAISKKRNNGLMLPVCHLMNC